MNKTLKAFTLVEMLIVIVIIGILIASLMPRMQSAQGRARDVARKNDLSQIQTAIITSQQDKGEWPEYAAANNGLAIGKDNGNATTDSEVKVVTALQNAGMTQVPTDPNGSNKITGLGMNGTAVKTLGDGKYGYMVVKRNSVADGGFVLMARTEVEGSSNWIVCDGSSTETTCKSGGDPLKTCGIFKDKNVDLKDVVLCSKFEKKATGKVCEMDNAGNCYYTDEASLRYILVY